MADIEKYRKKPVVITAMRWDGTVQSATAIIDWILACGGTARYHEPAQPWASRGIKVGHLSEIMIDTLEGSICAVEGDYVIRGVAGEFYPCKPEIFFKSYETVEE